MRRRVTKWILATLLIAATISAWRVKEPESDDFPRFFRSYCYIIVAPDGSLTALDAATTLSPSQAGTLVGGVRLNAARVSLASARRLAGEGTSIWTRWRFAPVRVVETAKLELYPRAGHEELFSSRAEEIRAAAAGIFLSNVALADPASSQSLRHPSCITDGASPAWIWWPGVGYNVVHILRFALPAILLVWAGVSFRRAWKRAWGQIRIQEGRCPACGYPLDPSHSETCPECGRRADDGSEP